MAVPLGVLFICAGFLIFYFRSRRQWRTAPELPQGSSWAGDQYPPNFDGRHYYSSEPPQADATPPANDVPEAESKWKRLWQLYRNLFVDSTVVTR